MNIRAALFSVTLSFCLLSQLSASVAQLVSVYVPVLAGSNIDLQIRQLEYLTWYALPESRIGAVLWPYKVNSPHDVADGRNINPASAVDLKLSFTWKPKGGSTVIIDVTDMQDIPQEIARGNEYHSRLELLNAVISATELNLKESGIYDCALVLKGAESQVEFKNVEFPQVLNPR